MLRLDELADGNISNLESRFSQLLTSLSEEEKVKLQEFAEWVRTSCFLTVNTKIFVLVDILSGSKYLNAYQRAQVDAALFGLSVNDMLKISLGSFFDRRMAFDAAFDRSKEFCYAALTAGYGGLRFYDPYCVQMKTTFADTAELLAYLPGDSLTVCFSAAGGFDAQKTRSIIGPHSHRTALVAIKFATDIASTPKTEWGALLARRLEYIEAIFVADITLAAIEKIQILKDEYDRLLSIALTLIGKKLDAAELNLVFLFRKIMAAQRDNVVTIEVVT